MPWSPRPTAGEARAQLESSTLLLQLGKGDAQQINVLKNDSCVTDAYWEVHLIVLPVWEAAALTALGSEPSSQGCLYREQPWDTKITLSSGHCAAVTVSGVAKIMSPSVAKGRHAFASYRRFRFLKLRALDL